MNYQGELMGFVNMLGAIYRWWDQRVVEAACDTMLSRWHRERPEYIDKIQRWIDSEQIPEDYELKTLCQVYQERIKPRPC